MRQMNTDGLDVISIDFENESLPAPFRNLRPVLYKDGEQFCCILGPDRNQGIFACATTQAEAISDWTHQFRERMIDVSEEDEFAVELRDYVQMRKEDVW